MFLRNAPPSGCFIVLLLLSFSPILSFAADSLNSAVDIKDIKGVLYFPLNWKLWLAVGLAVFLISAGLAAYFLIKKAWVEKILPAPFAHEIAYKALADLKASSLVKDGFVKEYFFRLSFIVRQYLENRFKMRAPEMTTEEFLIVMSNVGAGLVPAQTGRPQGSPLPQQIKDLLKNFLEKADMVKFAKYGPNADEIIGAFDAAMKLVDETKEEPHAIS